MRPEVFRISEFFVPHICAAYATAKILPYADFSQMRGKSICNILQDTWEDALKHIKLDEMKEVAFQEANKKEWRLISRVVDRATFIILTACSLINTLWTIFKFGFYILL